MIQRRVLSQGELTSVPLLLTPGLDSPICKMASQAEVLFHCFLDRQSTLTGSYRICPARIPSILPNPAECSFWVVAEL